MKSITWNPLLRLSILHETEADLAADQGRTDGESVISNANITKKENQGARADHIHYRSTDGL